MIPVCGKAANNSDQREQTNPTKGANKVAVNPTLNLQFRCAKMGHLDVTKQDIRCAKMGHPDPTKRQIQTLQNVKSRPYKTSHPDVPKWDI